MNKMASCLNEYHCNHHLLWVQNAHTSGTTLGPEATGKQGIKELWRTTRQVTKPYWKYSRNHTAELIDENVQD